MIEHAQSSADLSRQQAEVEEYFVSATLRPPWNRLPVEERINHLRHLVKPAIQLVKSTERDVSLCRRAVMVAARHGERRRAQGVREDTLLRDIDIFGRALISSLSDGKPDSLDVEVYGRVGGVLTLSSLASLRGFHKKLFEEREQWPGVLDELVDRRDTYVGAD